MAEAPEDTERTRAWLRAALKDADELLARYGSLRAVRDLLEASDGEASGANGAVGLRARLRAAEKQRDELQRRAKALTPAAIVRFLQRRAHCVGDVELLRELLEEYATAGEQDEEERDEVLMVSVQRMRLTPALSALFSGSEPATPKSEAPEAPADEKHAAVGDEDDHNGEEEDDLKTLKSEHNGSREKEAEEEEPAADATPVKSLSLKPLKHSPSQAPEQAARKVAPPPELDTPTPPKKRRGRPPKVRTEAPTQSESPPPQKKRRGRPPKNAPKPAQVPPAKRAQQHLVVSPRHILEWPADSAEPAPGNQKPTKLELEFRVVASLEKAKPWDAMYRDRPRSLRVPDLSVPEVLDWVTHCLSVQHIRRQAHWERLHWLEDSCCRGLQWEKYKEARQDRATLANRAWKKVNDEANDLMAKGLLSQDVWCDPAFWPLPEKPLPLVPKSVDLHAQIRQADMDEPMRVYYVNKMKCHPFFANHDLVEKYPEKYPEPDIVNEAAAVR